MLYNFFNCYWQQGTNGILGINDLMVSESNKFQAAVAS